MDRIVDAVSTEVWLSVVEKTDVSRREPGLAGSRRGRLRRAEGRGDDLIEIVRAAAEVAGAGQQVVLPRAIETIAVAVAQPRPGRVEVRPPGHQGPVLVRADVLDILGHQQPLHRGRELT